MKATNSKIKQLYYTFVYDLTTKTFTLVAFRLDKFSK